MKERKQLDVICVSVYRHAFVRRIKFVIVFMKYGTQIRKNDVIALGQVFIDIIVSVIFSQW